MASAALDIAESRSDMSGDSEQTLRIYGLYRIVLAAIILLVFLVQTNTALENAYHPDLFLYSAGLYFIISIVVHVTVGLRERQPNNLELMLYYFGVDILALSLIAHASGGLSVGLSLIMTLTVASGGIFFRDKLSLGLAALASIATLINVILLIQLGVLRSNALLNAGVLGLVFFATSFLVQALVRRIEASQNLAAQRERELAYSEYLNQLIVKRMQTGVLVIDRGFALQSYNQSATTLLGMSESSADNAVLPPAMLDSVRAWEQRPHLRTKPFRVREGGALLQSEFMPLTDEDEGKVLIFLEDTSRTRQQAQQIKLASLGRLTASIAHEIRNPLGAISHAAQLMNESSSITDQDRRLCDMITHHSTRMNRIIENVLQLSRRRSSDPRKFLLGDWLANFIATLKQTIPAAIIDVKDRNEAIDVSFDPSQLDQVLSNLCSNGLRYSEKYTGKSTLTILIGKNSLDDLPYLDVIDQGTGVAEPENLFEPFYTSESGGTGLGLFIARELCEANGSRLDYIPTAEGLSRFRITFAHPKRKLASDLEATV